MSHAKAGRGMPAIETPPDPARSAHMRTIKGRGTGPELALARQLRLLGIRPIRNDRRRPGKPDFSFPRSRLAVFVDGDFWHGRAPIPKTNAAWWREKFRRNVARDRRQNRQLNAMGWMVVRLRERDVMRAAAKLAARIKELRDGRKGS